MSFDLGASGGSILGKMKWLALLLVLSGCGMGATIGGVAGSVAGGAVDLVVRSDASPSGLEVLP